MKNKCRLGVDNHQPPWYNKDTNKREGDAMNEKLNKEINRIKEEVANIDKTNLINTVAKIKERIGKL